VNPALWTSHPLLAIGSLLPVPLGALWMTLAPQLPRLRERRALLAWLTWLATRVAVGVLLWRVLGHAGIDQTAFFLPQARHALAGGVPYRDFRSAYAPLFAPLLGVALAALGEAGPFILFVAADFVAWRALAAAEGETSEAAWAYVALPPVWYFAVRYAQDEPLCAAWVGFAYLATRRGRHALAGLALGLGVVTTKPLFLLPALAFLLASPRRARLLSAAAAPVALVYGAMLALRAPVWQPLQLEGDFFGVGPTLWRVPAEFLHIHPGILGWLPLVALVAWGAARLVRRGAPTEDHAAWQYGAFAALAPKFMPMYFIMWAPLVAAWGGRDPDRRGWLVAYGAALPLAWYLDSGALQGMFGASWRIIAILGLVGIPLLALWPLKALARSPARP
jgi:hypothetical protein